MQLQHSVEAQRILTQIRTLGRLSGATSILSMPLPHAGWWKIVSRSAKRQEPHVAAIKELYSASLEDPTMPAWPDGLYETVPSLPPMSRDETLAIIERFLRAEFRAVDAGGLIYRLHWEVLAAEYCALRQRYSALGELVADGLLQESDGAPVHTEMGLRWPLRLTEAGAEEIKSLTLRARLPTFSRVESFLQRVKVAYPATLQVLSWVAVGGGLVKLIEWIATFLANP